MHRNRKEEGPHLFFRVKFKADSPQAWSDWEWVQSRDAAFVREHRAMLAEQGISVSGLGLTDQMPPILDVISFPNPPRYMTLEQLDSTESPAGQETGPPLRVLFLGDGGAGEPMYNHNEVSRIFRLIAAAGLKRRVVVGQIAGPGAQAKTLWRMPVTRSVIRHLPWDYVVLQEHEPNYEWTLQDLAGPLPAIDREVSAASARLVYAILGLGRVQGRLLEAARTIKNPLLVPMSAAWAAVSAADRTIPLWDARDKSWTFDSLIQAMKNPEYEGAWQGMAHSGLAVDSSLQWATGHFSPQGHYLQALVYYRAITGKSPIGLPAPPVRILPIAVGKNTKTSSISWKDRSVTLAPREVGVLQRAAAEAFTRPIGE